MAIISEQTYTANGSQREFQVVGTILSDSHIGVWIVDGAVETRLATADYDVLGSVVLLNTAPTSGTSVRLILSDSGEDLDVPPSAISDVYANLEAIININSVIDEIADSPANAAIATAKAYEAEAARLTAESYSSEPYGVNVKSYVSNGDGTFTETITSDYSALHWNTISEGLVVGVAIDDTAPKLDRTYSSSKTQSLHDAQSEAIANLSGVSASFYNNTTQVIPEAPTAFIDLTWTTSQASTNSDLIELGTNQVSFKEDGIYSFLNTLTFYRLSDGSTLNVAFEMYDVDTSDVLGSIIVPIDMTAGTKETVPLNAVIPISGASSSNPVNMKVRMQATSANGTIELFEFSSIVVSQTIASTNTVQKDSSTGVAYLPAGTTAQRPALANGVVGIRYNTDLASSEVGVGTTGATTWSPVGGGATGGGADTVFVETSYTVTQDYTITAGKSAITVGDANGNVTIQDGVTISIPDNSIWVIQGA